MEIGHKAGTIIADTNRFTDPGNAPYRRSVPQGQASARPHALGPVLLATRRASSAPASNNALRSREPS
jgi:hypothetical protein